MKEFYGDEITSGLEPSHDVDIDDVEDIEIDEDEEDRYAAADDAFTEAFEMGEV
jgi:hypothetical protein